MPAPVGTKAMSVVSIGIAPASNLSAVISLFRDHPMGIKYTLSCQGALEFAFSAESGEGGARTLQICEYWTSKECFLAYLATRQDAELMKDWDAACAPLLLPGSTTFKVMDYLHTFQAASEAL
mmetsp:Transcript_30769/g.49470  ORF Transcript_30769/g.49470 Transcript_30769/m.49470 type:complete len:123 (-) Transcript_30769:438-806(-)